MTHADIFNVGKTIKLPDGRTYTLRKPDQIEQGLFQKWLEDRAHDAIDRSSDSEARKLQRHHLVDVDAGLGKYEYDGPLAIEALYTPAGMSKIIAIILRDQGATDEIAEEIFLHKAREAAAEILIKRAKDPKALGLLLEALGFPMDFLEPSPESDSSSKSCSTRLSPEPTPNSDAAPTTSSSSSSMSNEAPMG
jgi:hypothetical protein